MWIFDEIERIKRYFKNTHFFFIPKFSYFHHIFLSRPDYQKLTITNFPIFHQQITFLLSIFIKNHHSSKYFKNTPFSLIFFFSFHHIFLSPPPITFLTINFFLLLYPSKYLSHTSNPYLHYPSIYTHITSFFCLYSIKSTLSSFPTPKYYFLFNLLLL